MELKTNNILEIIYDGEKHQYKLSLPVGSPVEEALRASSHFTATVSAMYERHKKAEAEKKKEKKPEDKEKKDERNTSNASSS